VRDFIRQFRGLSGTAKVNDICAGLGVAERETPAEFSKGDGAARRLLTRCRGRPGRRNPRTSGSSAKTTFWSSFIDDDCAPESFV
jgi:hypothetical protein